MKIGGSNHATVQFWTKLLGGMVFGAVSAALFLGLAGKRIDFDDPAIMLAVVAGLSYALMGLAVGLGALAPRAGAHILNVEDEEELREQRGKLAPSAAICMLVGLFLLLLALAPSLNASIGETTVALIAGATLAGVVIISLATRGRADELMRQISLEASAATLNIALVVLAGWALLTQFGHVGWMSPLALIAGFALLELLAIFVVGARRGLMNPR
jgi:cytochrome bd-type quinol oxidase subunit 2